MEIAEIWRYPVKSMLGEQLDQASVGPDGIQGDRRWAVVDSESGVSLSAKRYADLLLCQASTTESGVTVRLPDGDEFPVDSAELARALSDLLGRNVTTRSAEAGDKIQHEFPTAVTEGEGEPFLYEPETKAFFDCAPLQLLTTATLNKLQQLLPDSEIHVARFRPNFLVQTNDTDFVENTWVGGNVTLGSLRCEIYDDTRRCIMVSARQARLPRDTQVIRTILRCNKSRAGVALRTKDLGDVRAGENFSVVGNLTT